MDSLARPNQDLVRALQLLLPIVRDLRRTIIFTEAEPRNAAGEWILGDGFDEDQALATITDAEVLEELRQIDEAIAAAGSTGRAGAIGRGGKSASSRGGLNVHGKQTTRL